MTSASLTASRFERAMTQQQPPRTDRPADPSIEAQPSSALASFALRIVEWRRRAKQARDFRGFDRRQLRDLGLNHFDQW